MLTRVIERPRPPGLFEQVRNAFRPQQQQQQQRPAYVPATLGLMGRAGWGKVEYARWVEEVKKTYKHGSLVTLKGAEIREGKLPYVIFTVEFVQEIHWDVQWDEVAQQPRCLGLKAANGRFSVPIYYPPANVRLLTPEELELVRTGNQKETSEGKGTDTVGGKAILVDSSGRAIAVLDDNSAERYSG